MRVLTWGLLAPTAVFLRWIRTLLWLTEFAIRVVVPLCLLQLDGRFDTLGALYSSHRSHRTDIRFFFYRFVGTCILDLLPVYALGCLDLFSWTCAVFSLFLHGFGPFSVCFKSVASFCHPQYILRTSPGSIPRAWNSRIWYFHLNNTLLPQRNVWNLVFATSRPESMKLNCQFRRFLARTFRPVFLLEKRPCKRFYTNVTFGWEMNPIHKHKIMSMRYQVKHNLKSSSWTHLHK